MANNQNEKTPAEQQADAAKAKAAEETKAAPAKAKKVAEKGDLKVAVHQIVQTGEDGKAEVVEPGTTFYPAQVDVETLEKAEAIREPTETERVMHERLEALQADAVDQALG